MSLLTLAIVTALLAPGAFANQAKPLKLRVVGRELYTNLNPNSVTAGPGGGTLSYCSSLGNRGLVVGYAWQRLRVPSTTIAKLTTPNGHVVKQKIKVTGSTEKSYVSHGSDSVPYGTNAGSAPPGVYKFVVTSSGHSVSSTVKVVAKSC